MEKPPDACPQSRSPTPLLCPCGGVRRSRVLQRSLLCLANKASLFHKQALFVSQRSLVYNQRAGRTLPARILPPPPGTPCRQALRMAPPCPVPGTILWTTPCPRPQDGATGCNINTFLPHLYTGLCTPDGNNFLLIVSVLRWLSTVIYR